MENYVQKFCVNCGAAHSSNFKFCPECGFKNAETPSVAAKDTALELPKIVENKTSPINAGEKELPNTPPDFPLFNDSIPPIPQASDAPKKKKTILIIVVICVTILLLACCCCCVSIFLMPGTTSSTTAASQTTESVEEIAQPEVEEEVTPELEIKEPVDYTNLSGGSTATFENYSITLSEISVRTSANEGDADSYEVLVTVQGTNDTTISAECFTATYSDGGIVHPETGWQFGWWVPIVDVVVKAGEVNEHSTIFYDKNVGKISYENTNGDVAVWVFNGVTGEEYDIKDKTESNNANAVTNAGGGIEEDDFIALVESYLDYPNDATFHWTTYSSTPFNDGTLYVEEEVTILNAYGTEARVLCRSWWDANGNPTGLEIGRATIF